MPDTARPQHTITWAHKRARLASASLALALSACALSQPPAPRAIYDFGPATAIPASAVEPRTAALALPDVTASVALDTTALQFRLAYANAQELRPYALARWSMPPAQLVQQRVRATLAALGPVLAPGEGSPTYTLKLELEEFSQQFDTAKASRGVVQEELIQSWLQEAFFLLPPP